MRETVFAIDPQNDFCDDYEEATLPVPGSGDNMWAISDLFHFLGDRIKRVVVTCDQHPPNHVAHPRQWVDFDGNHPKPFTRIHYWQVMAGHWMAAREEDKIRYMEYLRDAEAAGFTLTIWPEHCRIGYPGANIHYHVTDALDEWYGPDKELLIFNKSGNAFTEQFSSFQAAVPVLPEDPSTAFNYKLLAALDNNRDDGPIYIVGLALGHCVAATIRDLIAKWKQFPGGQQQIERLVLLTDCTSAVTGSEAEAEAFVDEFVAAGGRLMKSTDLYADENNETIEDTEGEPVNNGP